MKAYSPPSLWATERTSSGSSAILAVGVEADFDWLANNNNSSNAVGSLQFSANDRWITTLAGRVGVANANWLFYAKGGGGWVGVNNPTLTNVNTGSSIFQTATATAAGWREQALNGLLHPIGRPKSSTISSV